MIDENRIRRRRGRFAPVEPGVDPCNHRPRVRVGGRFAREVSGIELREGGVDVVEVEHDDRCDPLVGVDLDDVRASFRIVVAVGAGSVKRSRVRRSPGSQ